MSNDIKVPKYWHVSLWNAVWTANVWDNSPRVRNISKSSTALSRLSHCSLAVQTSSPDRHPGGEILSLSDWLIDTRSYCDWLVFYEDGKFARPITLPPRDNRWLSIGGKLKFTDLIGWANVDRIGRFGRFGPLIQVFRTYHYHNHSYEYLRVTSFKLLSTAVYLLCLL